MKKLEKLNAKVLKTESMKKIIGGVAPEIDPVTGEIIGGCIPQLPIFLKKS